MATSDTPASQPTLTTAFRSTAIASSTHAPIATSSPAIRTSPSPATTPDTPAPFQVCSELIAFESRNRRTSSVSLIDLCSKQHVFLTDDNGQDHIPKWSPDGKYIAFLSNRGTDQSQSSGDLWMLELDTLELSQVTHGKAIPFYELAFVWSPDGSEILYSSEKDEKNTTEIISLKDSSVRVLGGMWGPFSWSANGDRIALETIVDPPDKPPEGGEDLTVIPGQLVVIRPNGDRLAGGATDSLYSLHSSSEWQWSPDGQHLAVAFYASLRGGGGDIELVVIEEQRLVAVKWLQDLLPSVENKAVQSLSWSSPGKEIAFVVVDFSSRRTRPYWGQVFVVNRDFTDFRTLTPENMFCDDVQWSPDASQLVFVCDDGEPYTTVWMVNADGSNLHTITESAKDVKEPQ